LAWTASAIFNQAMLNPITRSANNATAPTGFTSLTATDVLKYALYASNTITPNQKDTLANSGYNAGQWVTGGETSAGGYTAGGSALGGTRTWSIDATTGSVCFQNSVGLSWTVTSGTFTAYGGLLYDSTITAGTVANQALCYNYFGGVQTLTGSGTFTVAWATVGSFTSTVIFNITV
jgi:hypothetical protein